MSSLLCLISEEDLEEREGGVAGPVGTWGQWEQREDNGTRTDH